MWAKAESDNWDSNGGTDTVPPILGIAVMLYQEIRQSGPGCSDP